MSNKELVNATVAVVFTIGMMGLIGITNYDKPAFYQSDLDAERMKLSKVENYISRERESAKRLADNQVKTTNAYAEMDSLLSVHAQNPEVNAHLEPRIDSLENTIEQLRDDFYIANTYNLSKLYKKHSEIDQNIERLKQDSIKTDSVMSQKFGPRFRNNWNKIFNTQRQR